MLECYVALELVESQVAARVLQAAWRSCQARKVQLRVLQMEVLFLVGQRSTYEYISHEEGEETTCRAKEDAVKNSVKKEQRASLRTEQEATNGAPGIATRNKGHPINAPSSLLLAPSSEALLLPLSSCQDANWHGNANDANVFAGSLRYFFLPECTDVQ